ncbi:MAG: carboxypeptidase-like regulatory domain-containing protein [Halobacteriales archaeon]|nr:carboxypeptidase-like regulatory domain-containing protein [Halobacteriales archaeon]
MSGWVVGMVATLLATALAGCAHGVAEEDAPAALAGVLHGIVVDTGIRPLAHVQLSTKGPGGTLWANTTATGAFAFPPLPPGLYAVVAHRAGFHDASTTGEVDGTDRPLRILMEPDAATRPYVTAYVFRGFIECSTSTVGLAITLCSVPNVPGVANVTRDNAVTDIALDAAPAWTQHELVWQPTQSLGDQLRLVVRGTSQDINEGADLNSTVGVSPLLATANTTVLGDAGVGPGWTLTLIVFAGGMAGSGSQVCTPPVPGVLGGACLFDSGATLEQEFTLYSHLFHGFTPPPGYRFSADGEPVPPQP